MRDRKFSRRDVLNASMGIAFGAVFPEPLKGAAEVCYLLSEAREVSGSETARLDLAAYRRRGFRPELSAN